MRETSVLYQQMLRAYISECERDPGATNVPRLATRRHVCVHVVYLAGSKLCEMGEMGVHMGRGQGGREKGEATGLVRRVGQPAIIRNPGAQVCEKRRRRLLPIGLAFSHASRCRLALTLIVESLGKFITSRNLYLSVYFARARSLNVVALYPRFFQLPAQTQGNDAASCASMICLALQSLTMSNWNVTSRLRQHSVIIGTLHGTSSPSADSRVNVAMDTAFFVCLQRVYCKREYSIARRIIGNRWALL